MLFVVTKW